MTIQTRNYRHELEEMFDMTITWNTNDPRLSPLDREIISAGENELYLSAAIAWEIALLHPEAG
jgi:PIN domain nuclease of toxin-antitoxin system